MLPKPVSLTQVDAEDYTGLMRPEPLVIVGAVPGGGGAAVTWTTLSGKPAVIAAGADAATARTAIGAGTSSLVIGTTAGTAGDGLVVAGKAPLASPTFTGAPKSTTPALADNTTNIATTAFVLANAGKAKTLIAALTAITVPDATDAATNLTLSNANKAAINLIIAALKA